MKSGTRIIIQIDPKNMKHFWILYAVNYSVVRTCSFMRTGIRNLKHLPVSGSILNLLGEFLGNCILKFVSAVSRQYL